MSNFSFKAGIPIFCVGFTRDDHLILGGGGGSGRSGVANKIAIYKVDATAKTLTVVSERVLSREEDAPMSLSVHPKEATMAFGINSATNKIEAGENENCRVFEYSDEKIEPVHNKGTLASRLPYDYQKVTRFNKDGTVLATGGTDGVIALLNYPALTPVMPVTQFKGHEILDLDFSADGAHLAAVSEMNLWIISAETGRVLEVITNPVLNKKKPFVFKTCRFGRGAFSNVLYTSVNGDKHQKPFVCMWDASNWTRIRTLTVGSRPISACTVSADGKLIAFASSDMGIRICSSKTLQVLMTVSKTHELPVTSLAFNSDGSQLASGSIDTTCRIISVPKTFPKNNNFVMLVLALLFLFLAALIQVYQNSQL
ncbi:prolactin regulatory element-binding protein [Entomortierella parvispora]|uniref:Prolactin regulatory element-binding protein n=1 Tax=Entomortierella parvispora TaxID=205924 RepID=A0A9P3LSB1_9FUNG|nr:prolactin regulatory element-binding protein [Entomortierella parvispora]